MSHSLFFIAGPCVIEDRCLDDPAHPFNIAKYLKLMFTEYQSEFYFKSSFDKANRTSVSAKRGVGLNQGMEIFKSIKKDLQLNILTDIHETNQAELAAQVVDVLQIPAFLCRQTDLLIAAGETGKIVNIKKGQFLAPDMMKYSAEKVLKAGAKEVWLTERGTTFGYGDLVVDMRSFSIMAKETGCKIIFDATHSVQRPGGAGASSGGNPEFIGSLARAAVATRFVDGVFFETHPNPSTAWSDGTNMLHLDQAERFIASLIKIKGCVPTDI
jgi:2-dehydro-3-deoxyphosphooctonate aldolase (KDO 8-P synthase)